MTTDELKKLIELAEIKIEIELNDKCPICEFPAKSYRHWAGCKTNEMPRISSLLTPEKIKSLCQELLEAREVLEFYGEPQHWSLDSTRSMRLDKFTPKDDIGPANGYAYERNGKRAREHIAKWGLG